MRRRLDSSGMLFPLIKSKEYSGVFTVSADLENKIKSNILKKAVYKSLEKFKCYKVKLMNGTFENYFEENTNKIIIYNEKKVCDFIDLAKNNEYLFKITYYNKTINLNIFHALTDGNGGMEFLKEIVQNYLDLKKGTTDKQLFIQKMPDRVFDYYKMIENSNIKSKVENKSFEIVGTQLENEISLKNYEIDLIELKNRANEAECTITQYLSAIVILAITTSCDTNGKTISVNIPVNLRKYYQCNSLLNFFSFINIKNNKRNLKEIINTTKIEFENKLIKEQIFNNIKFPIKIGENIFIRLIPLKIKKIIMRNVYFKINKFSTITISNLGKVHIGEKFQNDINNFRIALAPDPSEKIKCGFCSFDNRLVFTFTSVIKEIKIQEMFYRILQAEKVPIRALEN